MKNKIIAAWREVAEKKKYRSKKPKLGLRLKLGLLIGIWVALTLLGGLAGILAMQKANESLVEMYDQRLVALRQLKVVSDLYSANVIDASHKLRNGNMSWPIARARVSDAQSQLKDAWQAYRGKPLGQREEQAAIRAELQMGIASVELENLQRIMEREDKDALGRFMIETLYSSIEPVGVQMSELIDLELALAKEEYEETQKKHANWAKAFTLLLSCGIVIGAFFAAALLRSLLGQIKGTVAAVERVAEGDLSGTLPVSGDDEMGRLFAAVNMMTENLRFLVKRLAESAEQVQFSVCRVEATAGELTGVSASVEENGAEMRKDAVLGKDAIIDTAKALLELSALVSVAKERAHEAGERAKTMQETAISGQKSVVAAVSQMEMINRHSDSARGMIGNLQQCSKRISEINSTMTAIASQTKLLSLNAAIEAARSGEAGRGFNVVALEIGKLAEMSNASAAQVAGLIKEMTESSNAVVAAMMQYRSEVTQGAGTVGDAGRALERILDAVDATSGDIAAVVSVTEEEVAQSETIITLIDSLATVVDNSAARAEKLSELLRKNHDMVDDLAAGMEENRKLADALSASVKDFRTEKS